MSHLRFISEFQIEKLFYNKQIQIIIIQTKSKCRVKSSHCK